MLDDILGTALNEPFSGSSRNRFIKDTDEGMPDKTLDRSEKLGVSRWNELSCNLDVVSVFMS